MSRHLLAAIVLATAGSLLPGPAAADTAPLPPHDETRPTVMHEAAQQVARAQAPAAAPRRAAGLAPAAVAAAGRPAREVFGFADAGSLGDPTVGYPSWDFSQLSTVAFFGLAVAPTGDIIHDGGWNVLNSSTYDNFRVTAQSSGAKVVLTLILQNLGVDMCNGLQNRQTTVSQIVGLVTQKNADGVNIDYEGTYQTCSNNQTNQAMLIDLAARLKAQLPAGRNYVTIDTYASSAADTSSCHCGFFDVTGLNAFVDAFFVMEYALEYSNWQHAPLNCASFCVSPTSPLGGYYWNDINTNGQYVSLVGAGKVIMGVPYYGDKACVSTPAPNGVSTGNYATSGYLYNKGIAGQRTVSQFSSHRDANDPAGNERWDSYYFNDPSPPPLTCWRELYWDETTSLAAKYQLAISDNLRGVGLWNLNLGGGTSASPELWSTLAAYFNCPAAASVAASQSSTAFTVNLSAPCSGTFDVQQFDSTLGQGWFDVGSTSGLSLPVHGYPGHAYQFRARIRSSSFPSGWSTDVSTQVSGAATNPPQQPFSGLYALDAFGAVHADGSPPLGGTAYWPGWPIARTAKALPVASGGYPSPQSGLVLDGWGGLHQFGAPISVSSGDYFGWDIARDFEFLPDGSGGYVLDGYGGFHPFGINGHAAPPPPTGATYWGGWDIARKLVIFSDGMGGYEMDAYGGLHPFGIGHPAPAAPNAGAAYWPGWQIARSIVLIPNTRSGYLLDGYGGSHPFAGPGSALPVGIAPDYFGWDIARSIWLAASSTPSAPKGYTLDGWGGLHPFGSAPVPVPTAYWPGMDVARALLGQ